MDADAPPEPTPTPVTREWLVVNAVVVGVFAVGFLVGELTGTVWLQGVGGTGTLVFGLGLVGGVLYRRYLRWRYPTVFRREER